MRFARRVAISGNHVETYSDGIDHIPKQTLVGGLEVLLETGNLKIAESLPAARQLADELVNYRGRKTPNAVLTADTWREQPADDLVFAVGPRLQYFQGNHVDSSGSSQKPDPAHRGADT